ncbi:MAG: sterol carrier family protein [Propionibacteriaceae bacterium]|jgi:hypothetical protein|nr:sterol carrier family protein [Propionibacteriaceae bacterium]
MDKALAAKVREAVARLAGLHPGKTLEFRVPPYAAAQVGSAQRGAHTRGTPPNLVETDAETFLALCAGSVTWDAALADHRVRASGPHTDIGGWFPLG